MDQTVLPLYGSLFKDFSRCGRIAWESRSPAARYGGRQAGGGAGYHAGHGKITPPVCGGDMRRSRCRACRAERGSSRPGGVCGSAAHGCIRTHGRHAARTAWTHNRSPAQTNSRPRAVCKRLLADISRQRDVCCAVFFSGLRRAQRAVCAVLGPAGNGIVNRNEPRLHIFCRPAAGSERILTRPGEPPGHGSDPALCPAPAQGCAPGRETGRGCPPAAAEQQGERLYPLPSEALRQRSAP